MRRPTAVLGAVLTAGAVLLPAGPAAAGETLAPGGSQTLTVALPDWAPRADRLGVSVSELIQYENDCVEPESESGDEDCGATDGELADFLKATVAAGVTEGESCAAGKGVTLDLSGKRVSAFDVDGVECLVLRLEFPDGKAAEPDNLAQSDSITFTLDVVGERDLAEEPAGSEGETKGAEPGDGTISGGGGDPGDGTTVEPTSSGDDTDPGAATSSGGTNGAGGGATAAGVVVAGGAAVADNGGAVAGGAVPGVAAPADAPSAEKSVVGEAATPVTVDDDGLAVATESASSSLVARVLSWGSLFLGAVVLGGLVFVLVRRRRRERVA